MISRSVTLWKIRQHFGSLQDLVLFLRIFSLITVLPAMVKLFSIRNIMKVLTPRNVTPVKDMEKSTAQIVKYTDYLLSRNFWIYRSSCLKRSLVLYHFLRKSGIDVHMCLGVRYEENFTDREGTESFQGHAWLLKKGEIFLEGNTGMVKNYTVTYCFPESGRLEQHRGILA